MVDPSIHSKVKTSKTLEYIGWGILGLTISTLFIFEKTERQPVPNEYWAGLGIGLVFGFGQMGYDKHVRDFFNKRLREKFRPKVSYNYRF